MIAYSQLKPEQNNKASSLTNFFRNWGGSFGIAYLNMASDRRTEFHQMRLAEALSAKKEKMRGSGSSEWSRYNYRPVDFLQPKKHN